MVENKIAGEYETETEVTAERLSEIVGSELELTAPRAPTNDPLKNTAEQNEGLDVNAYSVTSRYLPSTAGVNNYKGSAGIHPASSAEQYAKQVARMVNFGMATYISETDFDNAPMAYWWGATNTMSEKFGWKAGLIEDAVAAEIAENTGLSVVEYDIQDVPNREKKGHDIVMEDDNNNEITFQVKTGKVGKRKDEDYLIKVDADVYSREIEFQVIEV